MNIFYIISIVLAIAKLFEKLDITWLQVCLPTIIYLAFIVVLIIRIIILRILNDSEAVKF